MAFYLIVQSLLEGEGQTLRETKRERERAAELQKAGDRERELVAQLRSVAGQEQALIDREQQLLDRLQSNYEPPPNQKSPGTSESKIRDEGQSSWSNRKNSSS